MRLIFGTLLCIIINITKRPTKIRTHQCGWTVFGVIFTILLFIVYFMYEQFEMHEVSAPRLQLVGQLKNDQQHSQVVHCCNHQRRKMCKTILLCTAHAWIGWHYYVKTISVWVFLLQYTYLLRIRTKNYSNFAQSGIHFCYLKT